MTSLDHKPRISEIVEKALIQREIITCCRCDTVIASEYVGPKAAVFYPGHGFCKSCYNGDPR